MVTISGTGMVALTTTAAALTTQIMHDLRQTGISINTAEILGYQPIKCLMEINNLFRIVLGEIEPASWLNQQ